MVSYFFEVGFCLIHLSITILMQKCSFLNGQLLLTEKNILKKQEKSSCCSKLQCSSCMTFVSLKINKKISELDCEKNQYLGMD